MADGLVAESAAASLPKPSRALHLFLCEVTRDSERLMVLSEVLSKIGIPQKTHPEGKLDEIWFKLGRQFKKRNQICVFLSKIFGRKSTKTQILEPPTDG